MIKTLLCLYNERSGSSPAKSKISEAFKKHDIAVEYCDIRLNKKEIKARLDSKKYTCLFVAGGDGTVRLGAELAIGSNVPLGILPVGTLNHFAKDAGIPTELDEAVDVIVAARIVKCDYCTVNSQIFVNNASLGLYPSLVHDRDNINSQSNKWLSGAKALIRSLWRNRNRLYTIETHNSSRVFKSPLVFIGNNEYTIDSLGLSTRSSLSKGVLFVYVVQATRRWRVVIIAVGHLFGIRLKKADTLLQSMEAITIGIPKDEVTASLDGELVTLSTPLVFEQHGKGLSLYTMQD